MNWGTFSNRTVYTHFFQKRNLPYTENVETSAFKTSVENAKIRQFEVFHQNEIFAHHEVFHPKGKFRGKTKLLVPHFNHKLLERLLYSTQSSYKGVRKRHKKKTLLTSTFMQFGVVTALCLTNKALT